MFEDLVMQIQHPEWSSVAFWAFITLTLLTVLSIVEAIYRSRTPQSSVAWCMALAFIPVLGLLAYWSFGRNKFKGYKRARDLKNNQLSTQAVLTLEAIKEALSNPNGDLDTLEAIVEMPFVKGNELELLVDATATYEAIFEALEQAQNYILLVYYIVRDDEVGQALLTALERKVRQGVAVYFIYDEVGSWSLSKNYIEAIKRAGVHLKPFNTRSGLRNRLQINFRNHRKFVIVDGLTGFAGGINIGEEYLGRKKSLSPWRDTHIKFIGPAALCAQLVFVEDWFWADKSIPDLSWSLPENYLRERQQVGLNTKNKEVLLMATGPADANLEGCTQAMSYLISQAQTRIWISTPYFIPNRIILNELKVAALRGVDVQVIIPGINDGPLVRLSAFTFILDALSYGIKIWKYPGFAHQKVFLFDSDIAAVGSVNLDSRSFSLNFEANVLVRDVDFNHQVAMMLSKDIGLSKPVVLEAEQQRNIVYKFFAKAASLLAPLQ